jgi:alginate O-acetyltransferase complex protein AlgI
VSQSVREFWRRWHITLSSWFRDYLYIPLGGGRVAPWKVQRNLLVVFVLCGLWHGASWNYVIWGLWHGLFLALERTALGRAIDRLPRPVRHVYALAAVGLGWVFFRAPDLPHAWDYFQALAGRNSGSFDYTWMIRANRAYLAMLALGILGSAPALPFLRASLKRAGTPSEMDGGLGVNSRWPRLVAVLGRAWNLAGLALPPALLTLAILKLAAGTYTPFIYAQF